MHSTKNCCSFDLSMRNKEINKIITQQTKFKVMKMQSANLFNSLTKEEVKELTTTVKETIASGLGPQTRVFSAAVLWNIQKQRRGMNVRRGFGF